MSLLCNFGLILQGTDQSFLEKSHYTHTSNKLYEKPRMSAPEFSVKHYAGKVTYNVRNFLDKNRDTLRADVVQLLIQSKNQVRSFGIFLSEMLLIKTFYFENKNIFILAIIIWLCKILLISASFYMYFAGYTAMPMWMKVFGDYQMYYWDWYRWVIRWDWWVMI